MGSANQLSLVCAAAAGIVTGCQAGIPPLEDPWDPRRRVQIEVEPAAEDETDLPFETKSSPKRRKAKKKKGSNCCRGRNECKGKGNCKTNVTDCAGRNPCSGRGGCKPAGC